MRTHREFRRDLANSPFGDQLGEVGIYRVIEAAVEIEADQPSDPDPGTFAYITAWPGGGRSRKLKHIAFNWKKFFGTAPELGLTTAGSLTLAPFWQATLGLYLLKRVRDDLTIDLSDAEASLVEALWRNGGIARWVTSSDAFHFTNALRKERSAKPLDRRAYESAVDKLVHLACIFLEDDTIQLRELVRVRR
jgi:hypothetical protein